MSHLRFDCRLPRLTLAVLSVVSCWALSPAAQADDAVPRQHVTIPFTNLPGHGDIVIRARFNDKLTGNFLVDTGAFTSFMDARFARKLGMKMEETVRRPTMFMGEDEIYDITLDHMLLGNMSLRNIDMFVMPNRDVPKGGSEGVCAQEAAKDRKMHPEKYRDEVESLNQNLDGILGMDILHEFAFLIDFDKERITAWPEGKLAAGDLAAAGMEKAAVVPIETDERHLNAYFLKVGFETPAGRGVEKEAIDTGAEDTMMTPHLADRIKVAVKKQSFAQTFYGCLPFSAGIVDKVDLNGCIIGNAPVSFTRKAPEEFPLLLGYSVLSQCRVLLDFPAGKMYVEAIPDIEKHDKPQAQYSDALAYTPGPNGEVFLTVQFDGGKTGTFALDTGANRTVVSPGLAASLNLSLTPMLDDTGTAVSYRGSPMMTTKLPVMRFGGMGVSGFDCTAALAPILVAGTSVDGILGNDFFSAFLPYIDFQKHQVTFLQSRDLDAGDFEKLGIGNAAEISLFKPAPYLFGVPVEIKQGRTMDESFLVSTLDPVTVLSSRVSQAMDFKTAGPAHQVVTTLGSVTAAPVTLDEFALAGIKAPDGMGFHLQSGPAPLPMSMIGLDLLSHYRVLLDYPNGRLYLANPAKEKPATPATPVVAPPAAASAKS